MSQHENPFINPGGSLWRQPYELFKMVVLGVVLMPLRVVLLTLLLIVVACLSGLATVGLPIENDRGCRRHSKPLHGWRKSIAWAVWPCSRLMLLCLGFCHIKVVDRRKDKGATPNMIVVAPHLSNIDVLVMNWIFPPGLSGVGDSNILKAPFVSAIGQAQQGIFINLNDKESREAAKEAIGARADPAWKGLRTLIFPEGRITNGRALIQFKAGAFAPGQPVQPVVLQYPFRFFDPSGQSFANKGWTWAPRLLTQFVNRCEVEILEPYCPTEQERQDAMLFANGVRAAMAESLGVKTTQHSYDDAKLFRIALDYHFVPSFAVDELKGKFRVDFKDMVKWLKVLQKFDTDTTGYIDRAEFAEMLRSSGQGRTGYSALFDFLDTDGSGRIEYRELVQYLALLSDRESSEEQARLAFLILDSEGRSMVRVPGFEEEGDKGLDDFKEMVKERPQILDEVFRPFRRILLSPDARAYTDRALTAALPEPTNEPGGRPAALMVVQE